MQDKHVPLHLKAQDINDVLVISSYVQDATVPLTSVDFKENKLSFLMNRFCWEHAQEKDGFYRVHCGLNVKNIRHLRYKNFTHHGEPRLLNLLSIQAENKNEQLHLCFNFSNHHTIHAEIEKEKKDFLFIHDIGEIWKTDKCPLHPHQIYDELQQK